ncbi:MAG TPA: YitT family protein, partial [Prolixibacteraceae bacterium]|nr:YitT family protein [Prolixibacteraceae bacterium]
MKIELRSIKSWAIMFIGSMLFSLGWTVFLIPADINGGGISGVGALVYYLTGIPAGVIYLAINAVLVVIAIIKLGANFGAKTIVNMLLISAMLTFFQNMFSEPLIDDKFLSAVLGGIAGGIGLGLVFSQGGTTGGTDIIASLVMKYRRISPGRVIMYCDVIIISMSWFVFHSAEILVYGYVSMWVVSYTLDAFLNGANQSAQIFIFSEKWEAIRDAIMHDNHRGVTLMDATGGYTNKPVKLVMTVVRKRETNAVFSRIMAIDPKAFITMGSVMGVYGEGF